MKIAFVTTYDAQDINCWSGIPFYMSKAFMDAGVEVEFIGNLKEKSFKLSFMLKSLFYNKILNKKHGIYYHYFEPLVLKYYAKQVYKRMQQSNADIIFSPGAHPIAYLNINKPIVLWTDATFANMVGYYPGYSEYSKLTKNNCDQYEKNVLNRAHLSCFSSDWAANSAVNYYKAERNTIRTVPFGANLDSVRTEEDIIQFDKIKKRDVCELLFVGRGWKRKGADRAIKVADSLNRNGVKTILHLVGVTDIPLKKMPDFVIDHGFLNKATLEGRNKIDQLFRQSHFFILPTRADCTPVVFSEANSFGLPVITCNTGGIPSIISDNINGKMFDENINIEECSEYIKATFQDVERYKKLSLSSFNEYKTKLNWKVSISKMISYMNDILQNNRQLN